MMHSCKKLFAGIAMPFMIIFLSLTESRGQDPGFFLDDWQEKQAELPEYTLKTKPPLDVTVNVTVDMDLKEYRVPDYIYGNNAVTWGGNMNEYPDLLKNIRNLNPHVLRWPGGNLSQVYFWNRRSDQRPPDIPGVILPNEQPVYGVNDNNWEQSTDDYYDLLANTNSTGIITVNYAYARYGTGPDPVANAAHLAADWVRYDNGRSKFWEIGNENFGDWEAGYEIDPSLNQDGQPALISGQLYGQHCRVFIDSMRAAAAEIGVDIKIGVVAYDAETSYADISEVWNEGMMPEVGDMADYLIVHSYFTPWNEDSPVSTILNSHNEVDHIMHAVVTDMAEAGKPMIPVAMTEWNIFAEGSMQQVSYINGMHAALVLGEFVQNNYGLATRWDLTNAWNGGNDHGMFSRAGEPGVELYTARPVFYYMYYFQRYFGDWMVEASVSGSDDVIAYASSFSSGESGVVIINKGTSNETVLLGYEHFEPGAKYYYHILTGGDDNGDFSRKVNVNGFSTSQEGGGPRNYETINAFAASTEGGIKVYLPSLSVVYLMVDKEIPLRYVSSVINSDPGIIHVELSDTVLLAADPSGFTVLANGSDPVQVTGIEKVPGDETRLNLILGRDILPSDQLTLSFSGEDVMNPGGFPLAAFSGKHVLNDLPGSPPGMQAAATDSAGTGVYLSFNKGVKITGAPAASFLLTDQADASREITITAAGMDPDDSTRIILTPDDPLYSEYDLVLGYSGPGVTSLEDTPLDPFEAFPVNNLAPGKPPVVTSAEVGGLGFSVILRFSKAINDLPGEGFLFTVKVNGQAYEIDSIYVDGNVLTIGLIDYIRYVDDVTVSFEGGCVTSVDRGVLQSFPDLPVENNLPEPDIFEIPGRIDAELFSVNQGMILAQCRDDGGGYNLSQIDPGDWVEYEVNVLNSGFYAGILRAACTANPGQLVIYNPDLEVPDLDTVIIPFTTGWQEWRSIPCELPLAEGRQRLRFRALTTGTYINWLNLEFDRTFEAEFVGAATNMTGDTIGIQFSKSLAEPREGDASGFSVMASGNPVPVTGISLQPMDASILLVALGDTLATGDEITVSYETGDLVAADLTAVTHFTAMPVTNNILSSVHEGTLPGISVFPNPVHEHLTIRGEGEVIAFVEILDLAGHGILFQEYHWPCNEILLTLDIPPGIYLLMTGSTDHHTSLKLVVF